MAGFTASPAFANRWQSGFNLNMFGGQSQQSDFLSKYEGLLQNKSFKDASPEVQQAIITGSIIEGATKPNIEDFKELRRYESDLKAEEARRSQELGKESLKETLKAKMFYDLPGNVAQAFAVPTSIYYGAMSQVPATYNAALGAIPRMQISPGAVVNPASAPSYFGGGFSIG